jgi:hypothetical protein
MNIGEVRLKNNRHLTKLKTYIILKIFFEDIDLGIESILDFTMIERRL